MVEHASTPAASVRAPFMPALDRYPAPPPERFVVALLETRTGPGDIVLELHGRGGWVARSAIERLRRAFVIESDALSRLVAEIVLRPPDVRHFDAAFNAIAIDRRADAGLRQLVNALFASRCAACGGSVVVDEFIWEADAPAPSRKSYRCGHCRDRRTERRPVPVDEDDIERALAIDASAARARLRARLPVPEPGHPLPDQLLDLYTPRALVAIATILERIEGDLRAPSMQAGLRLALVHAVLPGSRLNGYPGRVAALRIVAGRLRGPSSRQWRERNTWQLFDEGVRSVRTAMQRLEGGRPSDVAARVGPDLGSLLDGTANVALRFGMPTGPETFGPPPPPGAARWTPPRPRRGVRLAIAHPPIHWTPDLLGFAYLATGLAVGPESTAILPLRSLFGPPPRGEWSWDAAALRRSMAAVRPVLLDEGRVVIALDPVGSEGLVAGVIGGVGAGYMLQDVQLVESGEGVGGHLEFAPLPPGQLPGDAGPPVLPPLQLSVVEAAVTEIAAAVIRMRGEPTRFERILGEVLIGLDRMGHLRRLVGTRTTTSAAVASDALPRATGLFGEVPGGRAPGSGVSAGGAATAASGLPAAQDPASVLRDPTRADEAHPSGGPGTGVAAPGGATGDRGDRPADPGVAQPGVAQPGVAQPGVASDPFAEDGSASDPVRLTLDVVLGELRRPGHPRLEEIEPGRWWSRDPADIAALERPLSERVEWAVFGLLSTGGSLSESSFHERVGRMFRGPDTPDEALVRACLESYRAPGVPAGALRTDETLQARFDEHSAMVGMLVEFAHRAGLRAWIERKEQRRQYQGAPLASLLRDVEQRVYLPLVLPGPLEALEGLDCIWYVRGGAAFTFDVEWMAMLDEPLRRRGARIPDSGSLVRFLVIPPERVELVRWRLAGSPHLRERIARDNWHILRWDSVRRLHASGRADLDALGPLLGLDPADDAGAEQMAMFAS